jgi:hypothetical protein
MSAIIEFMPAIGDTFPSSQHVIEYFVVNFYGFSDKLLTIELGDLASKKAVMNALQPIQELCSDMVSDMKQKFNSFVEAVNADPQTSTPSRGNIFKLKIDDNHPKFLEISN